MSKVSQNKRILDYIEKTGSITPKEAIIHIGCYRLAARIKELEGAGHRFHHEWVTEYGESGMVRYMKYIRGWCNDGRR